MLNNSKLLIHSKFKIKYSKLILVSAFLLIAAFQFFIAVNTVSALSFTPQTTIGDGSDFKKDTAKTVPNDTSMLALYIKAIIKYAVGIVGILASVTLMFGGVRWLTAGGNSEAVSDAKAWIGASLTGLILTLCSYLILSTINPDLVNFKIQKIETVEQISTETGCCEKSGASQGTITEDACKKNGGSWGGVNSVWSAVYKTCTSGTISENSTGCCFNPSKSPQCQDGIKKDNCPTTASAQFHPVACSNESLADKCSSSVSCTGQPDGTSCIGASTSYTYQCHNGTCETCSPSGGACGNLRCCSGTCPPGAWSTCP